ncbi:peptidase S41, partial [Heyndrickxia sporothermodurans]
MDKEENKDFDSKEDQTNGYIRIRKFKFVMLIFVLIFATAGITTFALAFGDEKAVKVGVNQRTEFNKLYDTYDELNKKYYK